MRKRLRRNQNNLVMIGSGVILFGIWSILKALLFLMLDGSNLATEYFERLAQHGVTDRAQVIALLFLLLLVEQAARLYVGLNARWEGFGRKRGNLYVVVAVLMSVFHLVSVVIGFRTGFQYFDYYPEAATSLLMDLTSLVVLLELVNSVRKVRWLSREMTLSE